MVTPTAKTSTPRGGAHGPSGASELANTSAAGTPAASTPATIPTPRKASCIAPDASRLAPATAWPAASSSTEVVRVAPGTKTTSDATTARSPGPVMPHRAASPARAATIVAASTGISTARADPRRPSDRRTPTTAPRTPAATMSRGAGWRISDTPTVSTA
jgi:hypothetical protein